MVWNDFENLELYAQGNIDQDQGNTDWSSVGGENSYTPTASKAGGKEERNYKFIM